MDVPIQIRAPCFMTGRNKELPTVKSRNTRFPPYAPPNMALTDWLSAGSTPTTPENGAIGRRMPWVNWTVSRVSSKRKYIRLFKVVGQCTNTKREGVPSPINCAQCDESAFNHVAGHCSQNRDGARPWNKGRGDNDVVVAPALRSSCRRQLRCLNVSRCPDN
jgi:hypothetical protein